MEEKFSLDYSFIPPLFSKFVECLTLSWTLEASVIVIPQLTGQRVPSLRDSIVVSREG